MAAAAQNGNLTFIGKSGRTYNVNFYASDVAAAAVTFSPVGKAGTGSLAFWRPDEDVVLTRIAIKTGMTDTTTVTLSSNGSTVPGSVFPYAQYLDTLTNPSPISLGFRAGSLIGAIQA